MALFWKQLFPRPYGTENGKFHVRITARLNAGIIAQLTDVAVLRTSTTNNCLHLNGAMHIFEAGSLTLCIACFFVTFVVGSCCFRYSWIFIAGANRRGSLLRNGLQFIKKYGASSRWWKVYKVYHPKHIRDDPDLEHKAVCIHCDAHINTEKGMRGLSTHVKHAHLDLYQPVQHPELTSNNSNFVGIDGLLNATWKCQSSEERKDEILAATVAWVIEDNQPLNATSKNAF
jgi:hypothetical protein